MRKHPQLLSGAAAVLRDDACAIWGFRMAEGGAPQSDMKAHEGTYGGFMTFLKWGTAVSFLVAFGVVWLIAS